jgi:type IV secretion system protein VirB2
VPLRKNRILRIRKFKQKFRRLMMEMNIVVSQLAKNGISWGTRKRKRSVLFAVIVLLGLLIMLEGVTEAGTSTGLPWETPLETISNSLNGPVTKSLCLIMVVVSVGVLIFGGDLAGWARSVAFMALAAGVLGGASTMLGLFGVSGSLI